MCNYFVTRIFSGAYGETKAIQQFDHLIASDCRTGRQLCNCAINGRRGVHLDGIYSVIRYGVSTLRWSRRIIFVAPRLTLGLACEGSYVAGHPAHSAGVSGAIVRFGVLNVQLDSRSGPRFLAA